MVAEVEVGAAEVEFTRMEGEQGSACQSYRGWQNERQTLLVNSWGSSGKTLGLWMWKYKE
jgi:hypothetical protein